MSHERTLNAADGFDQSKHSAIQQTHSGHCSKNWKRNVGGLLNDRNVFCNHAEVHNQTAPYRDNEPSGESVIPFPPL